MVVAKRMTREELREDKVVTAIKEIGEIVRENSRVVTVGAVVVAAAIAGGIFFQQSRARAEENAAITLAQAQQLFFDGRFAEAAGQFESIQSQYGSARAARFVPLYLGNCKLAMGDAAGARSAFDSLAGKAGSDPMLRAAADRGLAAALADQGDYVGAAEGYRTAAGREGNPLAADDWMAAGSAFLEAGRFADAVNAFQAVIDGHPSSPRLAEARVRLAEARARS